MLADTELSYRAHGAAGGLGFGDPSPELAQAQAELGVGADVVHPELPPDPPRSAHHCPGAKCPAALCHPLPNVHSPVGTAGTLPQGPLPASKDRVRDYDGTGLPAAADGSA